MFISSRQVPTRKAFALVELLVVIGVIDDPKRYQARHAPKLANIVATPLLESRLPNQQLQGRSPASGNPSPPRSRLCSTSQ